MASSTPASSNNNNNKCDKTKCTSKHLDCYVFDPSDRCTCEKGYKAVIEEEFPAGYPYLFNSIIYTCCESDNETINQESYSCGDYSLMIPLSETKDPGLEGCTWDKCIDDKCFSWPGEPCHCLDGFLAKKTGQSIPVFDFFSSSGEVVHAYQFMCCPPETPELDGEACAVPSCDNYDECNGVFSHDVCFKELGCFTPDCIDEYEGCVSNKCNSTWLSMIKCWVQRGQKCMCTDGFVAKTTGRTSEYTGAAEYVCCPPETPGAQGELCNPGTFGYSMGIFGGYEEVLLASMLGFVLMLVFAIGNKLWTNRYLKNNKQSENPTVPSNKDAYDDLRKSSIGNNHQVGSSDANFIIELVDECRKIKEDHDELMKDRDEILKRIQELENNLTKHSNRMLAKANSTVPTTGPSLLGGERNGDDAANNITRTVSTDNNDNNDGDVEDSDSVHSETKSDATTTVEKQEEHCIDKADGTNDEDGNNKVTRHQIIMADGTSDEDDDEEHMIEEESESESFDCEVATVKNNNKSDSAETTDTTFRSLDKEITSTCDELDVSVAATRTTTATTETNETTMVISGKTRRRKRGVYSAVLPISANSNNFSGVIGGDLEGIHQYVLYILTNPETIHWDDNIPFRQNIWRRLTVIMAPMLSWFFLFIPILILSLISVESVYPRCSFGCDRVGETCSSPFGEEFCYGNGEVCPYLKNATKPIPLDSLITCAFIMMFVLSGVVRDMEQNHRTIQAANHRFRTKKSDNFWINLWIGYNLWSINLVRGYMIPGFTFLSSIAVLHGTEDGLKISEILLNGIAILVVGEIDDFVGDYLVYPKTQAKVSEEMETAFAASHEAMRDDDERVPKDYCHFPWLMHRIMSMIIYLVSLWVIMDPLSPMLLFYHHTSCDYFPAIQALTIPIAVSFASIDKSLRGPPPSWGVLFMEFFVNSLFLYSSCLFLVAITFQIHLMLNVEEASKIVFTYYYLVPDGIAKAFQISV